MGHIQLFPWKTHHASSYLHVIMSHTCMHTCVHMYIHMHAQFVAVEDHVGKLLDKIPAFSKGCKTFASESQAVNTK